jgi:hypothetical protein
MNGDRKIKRFNEFMKGPRLHRSLDLTIISGIIKGGFFSKDKSFELYLYHTPTSHRVLDHKMVGSTLKDLKIEVKVGDNIDTFRNWATNNGYKIEEFIR